MLTKLSKGWIIAFFVMSFMFVVYAMGFIFITTIPEFPEWSIYGSAGCLASAGGIIFLGIMPRFERFERL
jgi:membrane protein YdbS with pleckstrin-like domain